MIAQGMKASSSAASSSAGSERYPLIMLSLPKHKSTEIQKGTGKHRQAKSR